MNVRLLSWNVRRFNNPHKRDSEELTQGMEV